MGEKDNWIITYPSGKADIFLAAQKDNHDASRFVNERISDGGDGIYNVSRKLINTPDGEGGIKEYAWRITVVDKKIVNETSC